MKRGHVPDNLPVAEEDIRPIERHEHPIQNREQTVKALARVLLDTLIEHYASGGNDEDIL